MAARIPDPPEPPRPHQLSLRLSDAEKAQLERAQKLLAKRWGRSSVERTEVMRAALTMLCEELERQEGTV